eukprot:43085_1
MTSVDWFKEAKFVNPRYKNLVNGYINKVQSLFPWKQNSYFTIPRLINHICLQYYSISGSFNTEKCAKGLEFIDHKTVKKILNSTHNLCMFGEPISNLMCNIFRIEYTMKECVDNWCPYFSFAVASSETEMKEKIIADVIHWTQSYIHGVPAKNKEYSVSIYNKTSALYWRGSDKVGPTDLKFQIGDTCMMEHNFLTQNCNVYYNDKILYTFVIKEKCILPTLSIYFIGEVVEVTRYEFE